MTGTVPSNEIVLIRDEIRLALEAIHLDKQKQKLVLNVDGFLDGVNAQYAVDFLHRNHTAVNDLRIDCRMISSDAVEILRCYFATTHSLERIDLRGDLGIANCVLLMSSLHGNAFVEVLKLVGIRGVRGDVCGAIFSALLLNNSRLKRFSCINMSLDPAGARSMQPAIRSNRTLHHLSLGNCELGDEGISWIVNALHENRTILSLSFEYNHITSASLPLVTRLLQLKSLVSVDLSKNPSLFDNDENTRLFLAVLESARLNSIRLNSCNFPGPSVLALFLAVASNRKISALQTYDTAPLQGQDLENLLETISAMRHVRRLRSNALVLAWSPSRAAIIRQVHPSCAMALGFAP
jgi:Leucine Rich repeat